MPRKAISLTLDQDNLIWLRGQAGAARNGSVSQIVDRLVSAARAAGRVQAASVRSVVGTIRISTSDPDLARADAAIRALFPGRLRGASRRRQRRG